MPDVIKIEQGIPFPGKYPLSQLEVGDSFLVPASSNVKTLRNIISNRHKRNPKVRFTVQKQKNGRYRVWRTA